MNEQVKKDRRKIGGSEKMVGKIILIKETKGCSRSLRLVFFEYLRDWYHKIHISEMPEYASDK